MSSIHSLNPAQLSHSDLEGIQPVSQESSPHGSDIIVRYNVNDVRALAERLEAEGPTIAQENVEDSSEQEVSEDDEDNVEEDENEAADEDEDEDEDEEANDDDDLAHLPHDIVVINEFQGYDPLMATSNSTQKSFPTMMSMSTMARRTTVMTCMSSMGWTPMRHTIRVSMTVYSKL